MRIPKIVQYAGVAGVAAAVNVLSRIAYSQYVGFAASVSLAYATGHVVNYLFSRHHVFGAERSASARVHAGQFTRFSLVAAAGYLVTLGTSMAVRSVLEGAWGVGLEAGLIATAAHLSGVGLAFVANYLGHHFFSFASTSGASGHERRGG